MAVTRLSKKKWKVILETSKVDFSSQMLISNLIGNPSVSISVGSSEAARNLLLRSAPLPPEQSHSARSLAYK